MDNRIGEMQAFIRVVETGSFSEAARRLFMSPSSISKLIARLEDRLGARLIERSTRRLALTAEGQHYYERSQALIGDLDSIEREISAGAIDPSGTIRINASVAFGILALEPLLPEFWRLYPNIAVDLSLSDEIVDLYLDRTDIAFRVGRLPDSGMLARQIGITQRKIVASPAYLARMGTPETAADLASHNCLGFNLHRSSPVWPIKDNGRLVEQTLNGTIHANNGETLRRMVLMDVGLARLGEFNVRADLAAGRLVEVLPDLVHADDEPIHAVYLGGARLPHRVRAFLDFAVPRLQAFMRGGGRL